MSSKNIEVLVRGMCVINGKLLVCHTKGATNTYLPGGHVDFKESAEKALVREIKEEMGLKSTVGTFLGAVEHTFIQKGKRHCEINLIFSMDIAGLDALSHPESMEDYIEFKWVDIRRIARSRLEPASLRKLIPGWLRAGKSVERWAGNY